MYFRQTTLTSALVLFGLTACGGGGSDEPSPTTVTERSTTLPTPTVPTQGIRGTLTTDINISNYPTEVFKPTADMQVILVESNKLRAENGLQPLKLDPNLSNYAHIRAQEADIIWGHKRPDGSNPISKPNMNGEGWSGENMAYSDKSDPVGAVINWVKSPTHYKNIINPNFTRLGVGHYYSTSKDLNFWIQIFGSGSIYAPEGQQRSPAQPTEVRNSINKALRITDGKLNITAPHQTQSDVLASQLAFYREPYVIQINDLQRIVLRPHQTAGWSFQTIGELQHENKPLAYINVGQKFTPNADAIIRAQYKGLSIGDINQQRVIADVVADVDFSQSSKTMNLRLNNSKIESQSALVANTSLDFSDTLHWNAGKAQFESSRGHAQFYGDQAQEIGGQFNHSNNYRGSYGAKR